MAEYKILSENTESTVVGVYKRPAVAHETQYQSEKDLEEGFIKQLCLQGYDYLPIHTEEDLLQNLRLQLSRLNGYELSDNEWTQLRKQHICKPSDGAKDKTEWMQGDATVTIACDDGQQRNIRLVRRDDIHANRLQVINQYEAEGQLTTGEKVQNRYDVTILLNGLPMVHVELKRRGRPLREAFDQIDRYDRQSFWMGSGLFGYVQLFVISNGTETKYYSNTTRQQHISSLQQSKHVKPTSHSFAFTNHWADIENKPIMDLDDFARTFCARHALLSILLRYTVHTAEGLLLAMRPYQIAAAERILLCIEKAHNAKTYGTRDAGGYIWHTTGSGKTLTSFKTAQLCTQLPYVSKIIFVVDRKDLDYQTQKEYDRFQQGCANGNASTRILEEQLSSQKADKKVIITTIQKLSNFVGRHPKHPIYDQEVVMIFDECHRSQFGKMHTDIKRRFRKYYIFGFTGTPIFSEQALSGSDFTPTDREVTIQTPTATQTLIEAEGVTTDSLFGKRLHTYNIVDAIRDQNVLPFNVDYVSTMHAKEQVDDQKVWGIAEEKALMAPQRIEGISRYILEHYNQKTRHEVVYAHDQKMVRGFNSILCTQSTDAARAYYLQLRKLMADNPQLPQLRMAAIFSYAPNQEVNQEALAQGIEADENNASIEGLSATARDFLSLAMQDYNSTYGTNYTTEGESFNGYYMDISKRMKNRELDLLVVVNMFLTGFDATTLNTLWVDKNLRYHGLIQAFSRTNRILNSVKNAGQIICFRNLEKATNNALSAYGDKGSHSTTLLRTFGEYLRGYTDADGKYHQGYLELVDRMGAWQPGEKPMVEEQMRNFARTWGAVLRLRNILTCFDDFGKHDPLSPRDVQDYNSIYLSVRDELPPHNHHKPKQDIVDDLVFEMELVRSVVVGIDYILYMVEQYRDGHQADVEIRANILRMVGSNPELRDKRQLIEDFMDRINQADNVTDAFEAYVDERKAKEWNDLIAHHELNADAAWHYIDVCYSLGRVKTDGSEYSEMIDGTVNPFEDDSFDAKSARVLESIEAYFRKYYMLNPNVPKRPC